MFHCPLLGEKVARRLKKVEGEVVVEEEEPVT